MQNSRLFPFSREGINKSFFPFRRFKLTTFLRLVLAIIFALIAFIFSEVIPEIPPLNHTFLRIIITLWFGLIGFGLFPDLAKIVSTYTITVVNSLVSRLGTEVMNQIMRLPRHNLNPAFTSMAPSGVTMNQPLILDTSAIIDGRILDIAKTHFISGTILLPSFILTELQQVADSSDFLKRQRGRRGFEIINELKRIKGVHIEIWDHEINGKTVDEKLLKLAKNLRGKIITTDYNLNRVATLSNITVLNINDLANSVKTIAVPGENLRIKVVHLGKDSKQGVGYLDDGTMIVVEDGAELVGREINTEVARVLQVPAGRMIFAKTIHEDGGKKHE